MNLFEKYETLKKSNELITLKKSNELIPIGSVWSSGFYIWEVQSIKDEFILVRNVNSKLTIYAGDLPYKKDVFKRLFTRIK